MSRGGRRGRTCMPPFDLTPAAEQMSTLVEGVPDDALGGPTPCVALRVGDLLDHVAGLSLAFTAAAAKEVLPGAAQGPSADGARLPTDWRTTIPDRLRRLAAAWRPDDAWEGTTYAGPIEMPAPDAALVALDELVVHAWDLARATGQPFDPDPAALDAVQAFVARFAEDRPPGLFAAPVPVASDAPRLDRVIALTGRHPDWAPPA